MESLNHSNTAVSGDVEVHFDHKNDHLSSSIRSANTSDLPSGVYTEEENRAIVRKLDWHASLHILFSLRLVSH